MTDQTYKDAAAQIRAQDPGLDRGAIPDDQLGAQLAAGQAASGVPLGATDVDVAQLLAGIAQMQERIAALEAEKRSGQAPALIGTVESLQDLLRVHDSQTPGIDHTEVLSHADDLLEAARGAVQTGDVSHVTQIGQRIARWLDRHHPGPGDHHYYAQARDFAGPHLDDAASSLEVPISAPAVGSSRAPVPVLQGNVTG